MSREPRAASALWKWLLIAAGLAGVALFQLALAADWLHLGHHGFGRGQKLGVALGLAVAAAAFVLFLRRYGRGTFGGVQSALVALAILVLPLVALQAVLGTLGILDQLGRHRQALQGLDARLQDLETDLDRTVRRVEGCRDAAAPTAAVELRRVAEGLSKPVAAIHHPGPGGERIVVVEKAGTIRFVEGGEVSPRPFLDVRERVVSEDSTPEGHLEQGLLGMAFHPSYPADDRFFIAYTAMPGGELEVSELRRADADTGDPASERILLTIPQPFTQHNGGHLVFGPDGYLYVGVGDGGYDDEGVADERDDPDWLAQDLSSLLGKLLRLDVDGPPEPGLPYAIPAGNPFRHGPPGARAEIFALGFRNPWRFAFDRCDGRLFLGDVGRSSWEEIDLVQRGGNYGWKMMEGSQSYPPERSWDPTGLQLPIHEYGHPSLDPEGGIAVIGGHVYRGRELPDLEGRYLFADSYYGRIWSLRSPPHPGSPWRSTLLLQTDLYISAFGETPDGEIYVVAYGSGEIYLLAPPGA